MSGSIFSFLGNVRFADVIDVIIVTCFLYIVLTWLKRSASKRIIVAFSAFIVIYVASSLFNLYLTEIVIRTIIVLVILASLIVFQSDIRRMVDLVGDWILLRRIPGIKPSTPTIDTIIQAVSKMADKKIGALIAIKGREPWDRPVTGGIPLEGLISQPLLFSIFNTSSPGHDGAVLIEGDKIVKYGAHLSLSTNLSNVEGGTRHAAALGLSEQCDAMIIVVSEERGTISIANGGKISVVRSSSELKNRLDSFLSNTNEPNKNSKSTWFIKRRILRAAASFAIAVTLWFLFAYQSDVVYRSFVVPIQFRNLHSNLVMKEPVPLETRITLAASEQSFRAFDPNSILISIDLENKKKGISSFIITENNLNLPSNIGLFNVEPSSLKIQLQELVEVTLLIEVKTTGLLPGKLKLVSISPEPSKVKMLIPQSEIPSTKKIFTQPVELNLVNASVMIPGRLNIPPGFRLSDGESDAVVIDVRVK